jgi:hypothetical protein
VATHAQTIYPEKAECKGMTVTVVMYQQGKRERVVVVVVVVVALRALRGFAQRERRRMR